MESFLSPIINPVVNFISVTGYFGIFLAMTVESALIPLPSEITMPFAGFLVANGRLDFWLVVLAGGMGNLVGSLIAYGVGFFLAEHVIDNLISKYGKFILLTRKDYYKGKSYLEKYGDIVVFVSRLLPAVRTVISLPAGLAELPLLKFSILTLLGSLIWSAALTYVGFALGANWQAIGPFFRKFDILIVGVIVIGLIWYLVRKFKEQKHPV